MSEQPLFHPLVLGLLAAPEQDDEERREDPRPAIEDQYQGRVLEPNDGAGVIQDHIVSRGLHIDGVTLVPKALHDERFAKASGSMGLGIPLPWRWFEARHILYRYTHRCWNASG